MKKQYLAPDVDMLRYAAENAIANGSGGGYELPNDETTDNLGNDVF